MAISWLHLSDVHECDKETYHRIAMYEAIVAEVKTNPPVDFVFFTGDLAFSGTMDEYKLLSERFLAPLRAALPANCMLFIVPGNHDVDRRRVLKPRLWMADEKERAAFQNVGVEGQRKRAETLLPRFEAYRKLEAEFAAWGQNWLDSEQGSICKLVTVDSRRIAVVGINTAWLCQDDEDWGRLTAGRTMVDAALSEAEEAQPDFLVVLGHHPLAAMMGEKEWSDGNRIRQRLEQANAIYLHGHLHASSGQRSGEPMQSVFALQAPSGFQAADSKVWRNGLLWGMADIDSGHLILTPKRWNDDHRAYVFDSDAASPRFRVSGQESFSFPLPGHTLAQVWALLVDYGRTRRAEAEYRLTPAAKERLLENVRRGPAGSLEKMAAAFEEYAEHFAELRAGLEARTNDDPQIAGLKSGALDALNCMDLETANQLLGEVRRLQRSLTAKRRRAADEARSDLLASLNEEADTCARQADAALLGLNVEVAVANYREGIEALAEATTDTRWQYTLRAADTLRELGDRAGRNDALSAAINLYIKALADAPRRTRRIDRATTQNNLGLALRALGEWEKRPVRLHRAVHFHRAAVRTFGQERAQQRWAEAQIDLGTALRRLGEREAGTARLHEAVDCYELGLSALGTDQRQIGADAKRDLGTALRRIAGREGVGTKLLEDALQAYHDALTVWTQHEAEFERTYVNYHIANAIRQLGERDSDTRRLRESVEAYRPALNAWKRDREPRFWASAQMNLGDALTLLGEREEGIKWFEQAINAYELALHGFTYREAALDWANVQYLLGVALRMLGERAENTMRLEDAVRASKSALQVWTQSEVPLYWALAMSSLGKARSSLGERTRNVALLEQAVTECQSAADDSKIREAPNYLAMIRTDLADALHAQASFETGTEGLKKAIEAYEAALGRFEMAGFEYYAERVRARLACSQGLLVRRGRDFRQ